MGQKHFPVPYARKKLIAYMVLVIMLYVVHRGLVWTWDNRWFNIGMATLFLSLFALFVAKIERRELEKMPFIGKFFRPNPA